MKMPFRKANISIILIGMGWVFWGAGPALSQEKTMTPLPGGIPMIEGIKMLEAGQRAPDFAIKDADGALFRYDADEKGKRPVLFVFWSIFCEPCRMEMPIIQKLHEKYGKALDVVTIALDGEPLKTNITGFVKQERYTFRVLIDELDAKEMLKAADPYGVAGTPTIYVLDKAGKVHLAKAGRMQEEELEKAIQSVLKK